MADLVKWIFMDPWHYAWVISLPMFGLGWMVGHQAKTSKFVFEIAKLKGDVDALLTTIELKTGR